MGFLTGGPFYHLQGRTGNNVGRVVRGRNVFSMRPVKSKKAASALQLNQRSKMKLVVPWLRRLGHSTDVGFSGHKPEISAMDAAVSYNMQNAVTGVAPNFTLDYKKVEYCRGTLDLSEDPQVELLASAKIGFSWKAPLGDSNASGTDRVTIVTYNVERDKFVVLRDAALRSALSCSLQLPFEFIGDTMQCWIHFTSQDGKLISDSTYILDQPVG